MTYKLQSGKRASHLATAVHAILAKVANDGQLAVVRNRDHAADGRITSNMAAEALLVQWHR
jgi:hypothetical protein